MFYLDLSTFKGHTGKLNEADAEQFLGGNGTGQASWAAPIKPVFTEIIY
jgi:hypothetical protein